MDWLNLHISVLDGPEFLGAEPVDRATWLCLLRYCIGQENHGRIAGASEWGDRKWQQLCGVTKREIDRKCDLWRFIDGFLEVNFYPSKKQAEVEAKRQAGKDTVAKRWAKHQCSADSSATRSADTEGEGNRKGKDSEPAATEFDDDLFNEFWEGYGKKKDRKATVKVWDRLTRIQQEAATDAVPGYVAAHPDVQYRKDPVRYLRNESWKDELPAAPKVNPHPSGSEAWWDWNAANAV